MKMLPKMLRLSCLTLLALSLSACCCGKSGKCAEKKTAVVPAQQETVVPLLSKGQKEFLAMPRGPRVARFADANERKALQKLGYYPQVYQAKLPVLKADESVLFTLKEVTPVSQNAVTKNVPSSPKTVNFAKLKAKAVVPPYILAEDGKDFIGFGNLKIHTSYVLECTLFAGKGKKAKAVSTTVKRFVTEGTAPRLVKINGVPNVRDLGGRKGLNGKYVRQGLIYRTAGLNNNASKGYSKKEAVKKFGKKYTDAEKQLNAEIKAWEDLAKNPGMKYLDVKFSPEWTVFQLNAKKIDFAKVNQEALAARTIPAEFLGVKAAKAVMNKKNCFTFPAIGDGIAVFMKELEAPADGIYAISCGADWFWRLSCSGKVLFDCMIDGNVKNFSADNYLFILKLKKGKNLLVSQVRSGSVSWSWCCREMKNTNLSRAIANQIKTEKLAFKNRFQIIRPGRNRLNKTTTQYVVKDLGLRSDIDLRSDGECWGMTGSPAGKEVTWFHYSSSAYGGMSGKGAKNAFAKVFRVFLDEKNYPVAFHCIAGQDRTGAVAFILNGLLGVAEEELYLDWEATCFWNPAPNFNHAKCFNHLVAVFQKLPGKDLTEKVENYVKSCGFTDKDIAKFHSFMLE